MALHEAADPQALLAQWHQALKVDGFLMFSCLGPDTARELRALYARLGWPPAGHELTDMHDWGDMLVQTGFAEPVMDMERITLTYETPARLLQELAELGRNFHPARFPGLARAGPGRRGWSRRWPRQLTGSDGRLSLTFEVIYGHALKAEPKFKVSPLSAVSVEDMRRMLQGSAGPRDALPRREPVQHESPCLRDLAVSSRGLRWLLFKFIVMRHIPCCIVLVFFVPACRCRYFEGRHVLQSHRHFVLPPCRRPMPRLRARSCSGGSSATVRLSPSAAGLALSVLVPGVAGRGRIFLVPGRCHGA